jgi:hypothetical protein
MTDLILGLIIYGGLFLGLGRCATYRLPYAKAATVREFTYLKFLAGACVVLAVVHGSIDIGVVAILLLLYTHHVKLLTYDSFDAVRKEFNEAQPKIYPWVASVYKHGMDAAKKNLVYQIPEGEDKGEPTWIYIGTMVQSGGQKKARFVPSEIVCEDGLLDVDERGRVVQ